MALQAATELIADSGHTAMSARKVALKIGYTVGMLYLVFHNRDDLIFQVNLRTLKALREKVFTAAAGVDNVVGQLKAIANAYIDFARDHGYLWRAIYEQPMPEKSIVMDEYLSVSKSLFDCIEGALARLEQDDSASLPTQAQTLWGGVHGICILSLLEKPDKKFTVPINSLTDMLIERFVSGRRLSE